MSTRDPQAILQKLGQTTLKVDSFFLRRTGFIANQTILKLGEYNLNCIPATIGLEEARFLAVLTPSEMNLFSKFKEGTHILILTFDNPDNKDVARFPLRVGLLDVIPVPDRKNVCFLSVKLKSLPTELVLFLGTYMEDLENRLKSWETQAEESIPSSAALVLSAGLGPGMVLSSGNLQTPVEIVEFHTKRILLRGPLSNSVPGQSYQLRLVMHGKPLNLEGSMNDGGNFLPEFNPDWLDFVEKVRFHQNLKNRPSPDQAP